MATTLWLDSIEQFREYLSDRGFSDNTNRAYAADVKYFSLDLTPPFQDLVVCENLAARWISSNRKTWAPKTMNRKVTSLRKYLRWRGLADPLNDLQLPTCLPGRPHPLPEGSAGILRLIRATNDSTVQTLIALCGLGGLRIKEALSCSIHNIDLARMMLMVRGKGDVSREVPISKDAWQYIGPVYTKNWLAQSIMPLVPLSDSTARRTITKLGVAAGLERAISSHDLRATFATAAYDKCKDIRAVANLLGHQDTKTTMIYIASSEETLRNAVDFLEDDDD